MTFAASLAINILAVVNADADNEGTSYIWLVPIGLVGLVGILAGLIIVYSDRHVGRFRSAGLALSVFYLVASFIPPIAIVTIHWYGPLAILLLVCAVWNWSKWNVK